MAVLLAAALPASAQEGAHPRFALNQVGGGLGIWIEQIVLFNEVQLSIRHPSFWIVESHTVETRLDGGAVAHQWIDSRACPALVIALRARPRITNPAATLPDDFVLNVPPSDTPKTTLAEPASPLTADGWRTPVLRSDYDGEVAAWWWLTRKSLEPCWRTQLTAMGEQRHKPQLATANSRAKWTF
ncbi:hypothetical protein [Phenylobacterium deserti]|uniref:hypothetical protein n=1 Tax=Phenylobacterium deserti TaxID=1914756 RepID=UPI001057A40D|nr:hypothetical protein [Phenylobacterium deserti]